MSYSPIFISGNGLRLVSVSLCKARPGSALRRRGCVWWGTRSTGVPVILGQISYLSRYSCWSGAQFENVNDHLFIYCFPEKGKNGDFSAQSPNNVSVFWIVIPIPASFIFGQNFFRSRTPFNHLLLSLCCAKKEHFKILQEICITWAQWTFLPEHNLSLR